MTTNLAETDVSTLTESAQEPALLLGDKTARVKAGQHVLIDVLGLGSRRRTDVTFDRDSLEFQLADGGTTTDKVVLPGVGAFSLVNGQISFYAEKTALLAGSVAGRTEDVPRVGISVAFQARITGGDSAGELAAGTTGVTITA